MRPHEEHSNLNEDYSSDDSIEADDENGQVKEKKGRGYDKPTWGKSGKEYIEFTKEGLCLVPKDAKLSRFLGSLARTPTLLPLKPQDWRVLDNKDNTIEEVWRIIHDTIDWRPEDILNIPIIRLNLLNKVATRWRNYKATLKERYYTPYVGMPERFMCGDNRVDPVQWKAMVDYWNNDPKNKIRVDVNVTNRKKQKINHTGGTKSFARHIADFEKKHGRKPDPIEIFYMVHRRRDKTKSWVDNASEQMAGKISQELTQLVAANGEETPELRQKAYVTAMGFERRDRVRGYGAGVTPDMVPWVVQTQPASSSRRQSRKGRNYAILESQFLQLQANYAQQREEFQQDRNEVQNLKQVISSLEQRLLPHSRHESSSQQQSPSEHQSPSSQQSFSQRESPSQHTSLSRQNILYQHFPPYPYPPSTQFYRPQPYQPSLFQPVPHHPREFTGMLNDTDFLQQVMSPHERVPTNHS